MLGLVPTADAAQEAVRGLRTALPQARVVDRTVALPSGLKEARADIDVLQVKVGDLTSDTSRRDAALKSGIDGVAANVKTLQDQVTKANGETQSGIEALRGALAETDKARQADVEVLRAEIARAVAPTARARLETWAHTHAIFFSKDTSYRDPILAAAALDELAKLIQGTDVLVRVVGFTDEKGGQERNIPLSQARADKIVSELTGRGVPASRLVAVGRNNIQDLSPVIGDASPNRRVEFETGFEGEAVR